MTTPPLRLDRTRPTAGDAIALDEVQRRIVAHREGPLRVIAGPGTGKTATLVEAIVDRLSGPDVLRPEQILGLTFGRKAAAEWRDRVTARVGGGVVPQIMTFHSFAYSIVSRFTALDGEPPLRLLSGAEEEAAIRQQIIGSKVEGLVEWPEAFSDALGTNGMAKEIRALFAKAREHGIEDVDLARMAVEHERPEWRAAAQFMRQYLNALALSGRTDYTELIAHANDLLLEPEFRAEVAGGLRAIFVDEYQDTDPAQVALLQRLVTPETSLIVVGDPDQAIYAFRGADVRGIIDFPNTFRMANGDPAPTEVLNVTRRFGTNIREAASALLGTRGVPSMSAEELREHRHPATVAADPGSVRAQSFLTEATRADAIANQVRRWHAETECAWSDIAIIVRASRHMRDVRRALAFAGIPASVAPEDTLLHEEPIVAPLVLALELISRKAPIDPASAQHLLTSWIVGADVAELRRLGRALRKAWREKHPDEDVPSSQQLLADALERPAEVLGLVSERDQGEVVTKLARAADLLAEAKRALGRTPEEAAWVIWNAQHTPERLRQASLRGGVDGRRADHDLDAMITFFEVMERSIEQRDGVLGVSDFIGELKLQDIPSEPFTDTEGAGDAVRILTAHRAKGLQWDHVVIVGAEEGTWPDVRPRGSVLGSDTLGDGGVVGPTRPYELLAEERRLFYVALTRAKRSVLVASLHSEDESGEQVSRFVADAGLVPDPIARRSIRGLSAASIIAQLRAATLDDELDASARSAAIERLAWLADHGDGDLARWADPDHWWFTREPTTSELPVAGDRVVISGSALEHILACPLKWFYERKANASVSRGTAMSFGSIVHALAEYVGKGDLDPDVDELDAKIDAVWNQMAFEAGWQSARERAEARRAIERFVELHNSTSGDVVATEQSFAGVVELDGKDVMLRGSIDRIQRDDEGLHLWDFKTGSTKPKASELAEYSQLGVYQKAIASGFAEGVGTDVADAALVFLRLGALGPDVEVQTRPTGDPSWIDEQLTVAASIVREEEYQPIPNRNCTYCAFKSSCPAMSRELGQ